MLNRTIGMINKYFDGVIPVKFNESNESHGDLEKVTSEVIENYLKEMDAYHLSNSIIEIWNLISRTNKYIDETAPWALAKNEEKEKLSSVMYHLVESLRRIAILLKPIMENTSNSIFEQLGLNNLELNTWGSLSSYKLIPENIKVIEKGEPLFMRLEKDEEIEFIRNAMKGL